METNTSGPLESKSWLDIQVQIELTRQNLQKAENALRLLRDERCGKGKKDSKKNLQNVISVGAEVKERLRDELLTLRLQSLALSRNTPESTCAVPALPLCGVKRARGNTNPQSPEDDLSPRQLGDDVASPTLPLSLPVSPRSLAQDSKRVQALLAYVGTESLVSKKRALEAQALQQMDLIRRTEKAVQLLAEEKLGKHKKAGMLTPMDQSETLRAVILTGTETLDGLRQELASMQGLIKVIDMAINSRVPSSHPSSSGAPGAVCTQADGAGPAKDGEPRSQQAHKSPERARLTSSGRLHSLLRTTSQKMTPACIGKPPAKKKAVEGAAEEPPPACVAQPDQEEGMQPDTVIERLTEALCDFYPLVGQSDPDDEGAQAAGMDMNPYWDDRGYFDTKEQTMHVQLLTQIKGILAPKFLVDFDDIDIGPKIGEGAYSVVYKGWYNSRQVAVKKLKLFCEMRMTLKTFYREVVAMREISEKNSPHVLSFVGATVYPEFCIVTEYMPQGSLRDFIRRGRLSCPSLAVAVARDIAEGMAQLHALKPPLLHRDLTSTNILVDAAGRCVIGDFGVSRFANCTSPGNGAGAHFMSPVGHPRWKAPEITQKQAYTKKVDIYQYGTLLYELLCGHLPWEDITDDRTVARFATEGKFPALPPTVPPSLEKLVLRCWSLQPHKRPSFLSIVRTLNEFLRSGVGEQCRPAGGSAVPASSEVHTYKRSKSHGKITGELKHGVEEGRGRAAVEGRQTKPGASTEGLIRSMSYDNKQRSTLV